MSWVTMLLVVVLAACGDGEGTTSTSGETSVTTSPVTTSPVTTSPLFPIDGQFGTDTITIDGESLEVLVADTGPLRSRGLMGVDDLGEFDGMLFVFDTDTDARFWMRGVPIPLDIWFFDAGGAVVGMEEMEPCGDPCEERYSPGRPYRYALETEAGRLDVADRLDVVSVGN